MATLPKGYTVPKGSSDKYMRFEKGENRFRILGSPILGHEAWIEEPDGTRKPVRIKMDDSFSESTKKKIKDKPKHFWAMPVLDRSDDTVKVLEITQASIQDALQDLLMSEDWGDWEDYDVVVKRTGEGLETRYTVMPMGKKKLDVGIKKMCDDTEIHLNALFEGEDPFAPQDDVDVDDVIKAMDK